MTKTKKQLRAEAVERLRSIPNEYMNATSVVVAIAGEAAYRLGGTRDARDMCIDLLTDDDSTTESLSDGTDSREKLLEDANAVAIDYWDRKRTWGDANDLKRDVTALLDRQAAITEREHPGLTVSEDESLINWHGENYLLQSRVLNAERERDEFSLKLKHEMELNRDNRNALDLERIADLKQQADGLRGEWHRVCAERANLARDLGECMADRDRYRALCGQMLDAAHEIRRIADANMPEVAKEVLK